MRRLGSLVLIAIAVISLGGCSTPIGSAARRGDLAEIERLVSTGENIDRGFDFSVPLNEAINYDAPIVAINLLIEKGANINKAGKAKGFTFDRCGTPLHFAIYKNNVDVVKLLIEHDADLAATECQPSTITPLQAARRTGAKPEIIRLLVDAESRKNNHASPSAAVAPATGAAQVLVPRIMSDVDQLPPSTVSTNRSSYAVVIGIESYRQKLPVADFAERDAQTVSDYLTKVLGFPEENVVTLLNDRAAKSDFEKYFEKWLGNNVEPGGTVFVYYSGHGAPNPKTGDAYLVPYDGDPAFIDETGYSLKRMYAALGKLPAKSIVVALDSCFSGAGGRSVIAKGTRSITLNLKDQAALPRNMTVLAASSGEQTSSTYDEKGHGLFTYFLLKGIKNEDVVAPDGSLRLDDLFAYLGPQVERVARKQYNNEQTPQLIEPKKN